MKLTKELSEEIFTDLTLFEKSGVWSNGTTPEWAKEICKEIGLDLFNCTYVMFKAWELLAKFYKKELEKNK